MPYYGTEFNGLQFFSSNNKNGKRYHFRTENGKTRAYEMALKAELKGQGIRRAMRRKAKTTKIHRSARYLY